MFIGNKLESFYKAQIYRRYDELSFIKYFAKEDFKGLEAAPYEFLSSHGHKLRGYFYSYPGYDEKRLVVFEHGLGAGHRSYLKEIEVLCSAGFRVFAYDHTGCAESEGESTCGFAESLCDLDDCIKALKADSKVESGDISVIGHSWGGYSTLNIPALHPDIKRIVVMSGFVSVKAIVGQYFVGPLRIYRKRIMALEASSNPGYVNYDGAASLAKAKTKALLIYSDNDGVVKKKHHYDVLKKSLGNCENVEFLLVSGKGHNPNYTADAAKYIGELNSALRKHFPRTDEEKETFKNSFDWDRMTAQDCVVWDKIKSFLK